MDDSPSKPLLILDLDETLIHGSEARLHRSADFMMGPFHIYKRPLLAPFLNTITQCYDVAIWSSASRDYVEGIANVLCGLVPEWRFVWSREKCVQRMDPETFETCFLKDLRKVERLGFALDRILIVDDTRQKVSRNYGNAIYITEFMGSDDDNELPRLAEFLLALHREPNFRRIEKRGWRTRYHADIAIMQLPRSPGSNTMDSTGGFGGS